MSTPSSTMDPLEMEELHPRPSARAVRSQYNAEAVATHQCRTGCLLLKLYMEAYPLISAIIFFLCILLTILVLVEQSPSHHRRRHELSHDYSTISSHYNFKAAQMDHWCLFGGDDDCSCDDFTEPVSREQMKGWLQAHEQNKELAIDAARQRDLDVVFLGDEVTEVWNGRLMNLPISINPDGKVIQEYFEKTFTKAGGGQFEGVALGISGDSSSNLLWRIQHGEVPSDLTSKVWWILVGTNDLARGECSEEAAVLGILRTAEEVSYRHPGDIVVIQGILPRSNRPDGSLATRSSVHSLFRRTHTEEYARKAARDEFLLWPSIVRINQELALFCEKHRHFVYFDATNLFLGSMGNDHYRQQTQEIIPALMRDFVHPTEQGMELLGNAIAKELNRIIYEADEDNDIETTPESRR